MQPEAQPGRPEAYTVRLEKFEGPLDLLLHLIRRADINIYDIPIAQITEQYLEIIRDLAALDIDRASEFLVMAATLLGIKSRMLLPKPPKVLAEELPEEQGADPREELVRQLVAYSQYKEAAEALKRREADMAGVFTRALFVEQPSGPAPLEGLSLKDLVKAFEEVLKEEWTWREVPREEIPLREKIREINFRISRSPHGVRFRDLFTRGGGRLEVVVTFLALLELMRRRQVVALQEGIFGEILIRRVVITEQPAEPDEDEE
ncbi:MAG TPA: segregation/condensation protein A [Symbiobacteriaceae bacterium]|nr:segregation/condensation protein A [Symbiobacteriaceae bacterium]